MDSEVVRHTLKLYLPYPTPLFAMHLMLQTFILVGLSVLVGLFPPQQETLLHLALTYELGYDTERQSHQSSWATMLAPRTSLNHVGRARQTVCMSIDQSWKSRERQGHRELR